MAIWKLSPKIGDARKNNLNSTAAASRMSCLPPRGAANLKHAATVTWGNACCQRSRRKGLPNHTYSTVSSDTYYNERRGHSLANFQSRDVKFTGRRIMIRHHTSL